MPNELKENAEKTGCDLSFEFSQVAFLANNPDIASQINNSSGICYGYAFIWLDYWAQNISPQNDIGSRPIGEKAKDIYLLQTELRYMNKNTLATAAAESCGNITPALSNDDNMKIKVLKAQHKSDIKKLVAWLQQTNKKRYFTIHSGRHTMAACGSATGTLRFFDPNFGAISTNNASHLAKCLAKFFMEKRIKDNYWSNDSSFALSIRKYK